MTDIELIAERHEAEIAARNESNEAGWDIAPEAPKPRIESDEPF
jgi:hypothetical protein